MTTHQQCSQTLSVQCLSDEGHANELHQNGISTWTSDALGASTRKTERPSRGERLALDKLLSAVRTYIGGSASEEELDIIAAMETYDAEVERLAPRDALLAALESAALMYGTDPVCGREFGHDRTLLSTARDLAEYDATIHPHPRPTTTECTNIWHATNFVEQRCPECNAKP